MDFTELVSSEYLPYLVRGRRPTMSHEVKQVAMARAKVSVSAIPCNVQQRR